MPQSALSSQSSLWSKNTKLSDGWIHTINIPNSWLSYSMCLHKPPSCLNHRIGKGGYKLKKWIHGFCHLKRLLLLCAQTDQGGPGELFEQVLIQVKSQERHGHILRLRNSQHSSWYNALLEILQQTLVSIITVCIFVYVCVCVYVY